MPKKKRSRNGGKKGASKNNKETILIEPEPKIKMEGTDGSEAASSNISEQGSAAASTSASQTIQQPATDKPTSGIPKKRFSFSSKKKKEKHEAENKEQKSDGKSKKSPSKTGEIKRSNSMSLHDSEQRSKIPLLKHSRSLHHKGKNLSASCSNFETQSMVLNPGMDDWRMTGLLKNVEKSNSMCSLSSPARSRESESSSKIPIASSTSNKSSLPKPLVADGSSSGKGIVNNAVDAPEEIEQTDYSACDVIIEETSEDQVNGDSKSKPDDSKSKPVDAIDKSLNSKDIPADSKDKANESIVDNENNVNNISTECVQTYEQVPNEKNELECDSNKDTALPAVKDDTIKNTDEEVVTNSEEHVINSDISSDKSDTMVIEEECYEIDGDNVVTVQPLEELIEKQKIEMPSGFVLSNDWLVLDILHHTKLAI